MGNEERDLLYKIAGDVGFVRAQVEVLMDAKLTDRMTFVEGQQKVQNGRMTAIEKRGDRLFGKSMVALGTIAAVVSTAAALTHFVT